MFISSEIEQNTLNKNLEFFFPLGEGQRGCFFGRCGIFRYQFEEALRGLEAAKKIDVDKPLSLSRHSMEKLLFMAIWMNRLEKTIKDCKEAFGISISDAIECMLWICNFVSHEIELEHTYERARRARRTGEVIPCYLSP